MSEPGLPAWVWRLFYGLPEVAVWWIFAIAALVWLRTRSPLAAGLLAGGATVRTIFFGIDLLFSAFLHAFLDSFPYELIELAFSVQSLVSGLGFALAWGLVIGAAFVGRAVQKV